MSCAEVLEAIARGRLEDQTVVNHLSVCAECRARSESAQILGRHLADPVMWEEPSSDLADRVVAAIDAETGQEERRPSRWRILGAAAALCVVVVGGMVWGNQPDWTVELAPGPAAPEAGGVIRGWNHAHGTRMVLEVWGLDPADENSYYELWLTAPDGRHVSAGTFRDSGSFEVVAGVRRADYPRIWVTLEPADEDPGPTSQTVLDTPNA
ncbi:MAG TPA: anti-sigma factor [Acidimicrobiia bacterium]|jgi:hypothetical protein